MKYAHTGFSIVLALGLMLLLSFTGLYLIEYMIPYSRSIKGIENASQTFFESYSGVEDALYSVYSQEWEQDAKTLWSDSRYSYNIISNGTILPPVWWWNSPYDPDWNILSLDDPISLKVWKNRLNSWSNRFELSLRIPDINTDGIRDSLKTSDGVDDVVIWQLSSGNETIFSRSGSLVSEWDINNGVIDLTDLWNGTKYSQGITLGWEERSFQWFYNNNSSPCNNEDNECVLQLSLLRELRSDDDTILPFLEYKIQTTWDIPTRFFHLESQGISFGFNKTLRVSVPQQTTNSAFNFTIFQ